MFFIPDDEHFNRLRSAFLATGRGRRPKLPTFTLTNKFLIQLYFCKEDRSWDTLTNFAQTFIDLDKDRIRHLIEKTFTNAASQDKDVLDKFLQDELLPFIGIQLSSAGVTRESVLTLTPHCPPVVLTNGMLIELDKLRNKERLRAAWLKDAVHTVSGHFVEGNVLSKEMKKLWDEYRRRSKSRVRDQQGFHEFIYSVSEFLSTPSTDDREQLDQGASTSQGGPSATAQVLRLRDAQSETELTPTAAKVNSVESLTPEIPRKRFCDEQNRVSLTPQSQGILIKKQKGTITELERQLITEGESVLTLKQLVQKGNTDICRLKTSNEKLENTVTTLEDDLGRMNDLLTAKKQELSKVKQSAFYKRLKRKEANIPKKVEDLEKMMKYNHQQETNALKSKLRSTQTQLSNSRLSLRRANEDRQHLNKVIGHLKDDVIHLTEEDNVKVAIETREEGSKKFTKNVVKCVIQLIGETEVSAKNCGTAMKIVCDNLLDIQLNPEDLPSERSSLRFADQGHILAKHQIAEALLETSYSDLHSDGTTRDHRKYVGHQVTIDSGKSLSCGFIPVCQENTATLVDIAYGLLQELADVYDAEKVDEVFKGMLKNLSGLMSDRASVMKSFDKAFSEKRKDLLETEEDMEFLHCNAHFLLGLSSEGDKVLKEWEKAMAEPLGRDASGKFSSFASSSETSTSRLIRTGCDILGPRGDEKNGCRDSWEAFCSLQDVSSHIASFKGNRFNNYFQAATALHFHRDQVTDFLQNFMSSLNRKQDSVLLDVKCETLDCAMVALGVVYEKITGPYWLLMGQEVHYLDFYMHVCSLHQALTDWSADATEMFKKDTPTLFGLQVQSPIFLALYDVSAEKKQNIVNILQKLCTAFKSVVERQLCDFLPGGRYHNVQSAEVRTRLNHSKITNLLGEECFGDLDFSIFKRRNASMHHHSTVNMLKRNKTSAWFSTKSDIDQEHLLAVAARKSRNLRDAHQRMQKQVVAKRKEMLQVQRREKEVKAQKALEKKTALVATVKEHGGPCLSGKCVDKLVASLSTLKEKTQAVKNEIRYQKLILGAESPLLKLTCPLDTLLANLHAYLGSDVVGQSTSLDTLDDDTDTVDDDSDTVDGDTEDEPVDSAQFGEFNFTKQGQNVAVYFDDDFYIGQVVSIETPQVGDVKFMDKCGLETNVYKWPRSDATENIASMFVFSWDFELSTSNGRMWQLGEYTSVSKKYELYKELFC